jgi:hypothetical protein
MITLEKNKNTFAVICKEIAVIVQFLIMWEFKGK